MLGGRSGRGGLERGEEDDGEGSKGLEGIGLGGEGKIRTDGKRRVGIGMRGK